MISSHAPGQQPAPAPLEAAAQAPLEAGPGLYVLAAFGAHYVDSAEFSDYLSPASGPLGSRPSGDWDGVVNVGLEWSPGGRLLWGLEAFSEGTRTHALAATSAVDGSLIYREIIEQSRQGLDLLGGVTWASGLFGLFSGRLAWLAALRAGAAFLNGRKSYRDASGSGLGSFDEQASAPEAAALLRAHTPLEPGTGLGLELGYEYCRFDYVGVGNPQGYYAGLGSPELTSGGAAAAFNYSGPYARVVLEFGRLPFRRPPPSGNP